MQPCELFEQHPRSLTRYQQRWFRTSWSTSSRTRTAPSTLVCQLAGATHRNLAVVGDDDQSIYSWRGADMRNILDFERDYPDAKVVKLEQNYRSTQTILDAAHAVVSRNAGRKDKKLWTDRGAGAAITLFDAYNEYEEAEFVARQVEKLVGGGGRTSMSRLLTSRADDDDGARRYGEVAVAYRINAQSRVLEESFMRFGIPYQLVGGTRFYERREVKDALAYVRLARNPRRPGRAGADHQRPGPRDRQQDAGGAARLGRRPRRRPLDRGHRGGGEPEPRAPRTCQPGRVRGGGGAAHRGGADRAAGTPVRPRHRAVGLRESIQDGTDEGDERWTNVLELRNHAAEYDEIAPPEGLARFLEEVALVSDQDTLEDRPDRVTLITLHAAKGLEFPVVFIVGMEEGMLPHQRALEDERELEEERRLAYVGMTRAKDQLYLVHAHHRSTFGVGAPAEPSRFLAELPEDLLKAERTGTPFRRGGRTNDRWSPRGTDAEGWLPGGYRSPTRRVNEPLRPVNLPDMSAPPVGASLDAAREKVASSGYRARPGPRPRQRHVPRRATPAEEAAAGPRWQTGDRVRHRRYGIGLVVAQRDREGGRGGDGGLRGAWAEVPDRGLRRAGARLVNGEAAAALDAGDPRRAARGARRVLRRPRRHGPRAAHRARPGR